MFTIKNKIFKNNINNLYNFRADVVLSFSWNAVILPFLCCSYCFILEIIFDYTVELLNLHTNAYRLSLLFLHFSANMIIENNFFFYFGLCLLFFFWPYEARILLIHSLSSHSIFHRLILLNFLDILMIMHRTDTALRMITLKKKKLKWNWCSLRYCHMMALYFTMTHCLLA